MANSFLSSFAVKFIAALTVLLVAVIGAGLGWSLAETTNIKNNENFTEFAPALPTKILDINGELVTEFASEEKRELVSLSELPRHLIHAVLAREDPDFYNHRGFSIRAIARAAWGQIKKGPGLGGGSTITQQVAGTLYANRSERTVTRKIRELWWALQMERRYTKNEILEIYLNYMPMGPGTYGVETASKYFFGHSAREVSLAESAVLAVLLSSPTGYNPLRNPNQAMDRQNFVLDRMIEFGYTTREEADTSFTEYWENFDWSRPSIAAYYTREDKAPWFSEYVRRELDGMMYGSMDYYRDGYIVHTTLDLKHQEAAERLIAEGLTTANRNYQISSRRGNTQIERTYLPVIDLLTLVFDLEDIRITAAGQNQARASSRYIRTINPIVDMAALVFGIPELKDATGISFAQLKTHTEENVVEGALISIENETGYITAIVGGSKYDDNNQFIRATQASLQPGSAFKSLYYSAAIDTRRVTAASLIYDSPMVFHNEDSTPYIPNNYGGLWRGPVLLYNAHALSLNIPSLKILEITGFDAAIERSAALMGITDPAVIRRSFPRYYSLGLGVNSTSPLQLARAFAVFGNQGRAVTPIAIRMVEDRNGRVVFDVERETRQRQRRMGDQIVSPQNAYVMTRIMEKTVEVGTLYFGSGRGSKFLFRDENNNTFRLPVAGKSGTTQNWADAWAVGYSPYYTVAVWYGFDKPGNSLGVDVAGATLAGPVWGDYLREIHMGLPQKTFARPSTGVLEMTVCIKSGLLRTEFCNEGQVYLPFLEGTQPARFCDVHGSSSPFETRIPVRTIPFGGYDGSEFLDSLSMPQLPSDILDFLDSNQPNRNQDNRQNQNNSRNQTNTLDQNIFGNPFLDDDYDYEPQRSEQPVSGQSDTTAPFDTNETFVPRREEELFNINSFAPDDDLPSWNPLLE